MVSAPPATQDASRAEQDDFFSSSLWKLWTLLDLQPSDRALFVGATLPAGNEGPEGAGFVLDRCKDVGALVGLGQQYRTVVWGPPFDRFDRDIGHVVRALAPGGRLLLFCPNRLSLFRGRHSLRALLDPALHTLTGYRKCLGRAGLRVDESWLPWPTLESAEEYVAAEDYNEMRMSTGVSTAFAARMRAALHDGFVLLASRSDAGAVPAIGERIARSAGAFIGVAGHARVTRFDLRQRGALVLMLMHAGSDQRWVGRVCRHSEVATHIEANEKIVSELRRAAESRPEILRFLPRPRGSVDVDGAIVWLEDRLPGTVAWRLPQRLRSAVDEGWMQFMTELGKVVVDRADLDERTAAELVQRWRRGSRILPRALEEEIAWLEGWLQRKLIHQSRTLGWCHGDFGYGNLLADRHSGQLQAVIDWETGRTDEMTGIDWMNILVVGERMHSDLATGVRRVARRMQERAKADRPAALLAAYIETANPGCDAEELLGLALLRIVQREARYPSLFAQSEQEFWTAVRAFRTIIEAK